MHFYKWLASLKILFASKASLFFNHSIENIWNVGYEICRIKPWLCTFRTLSFGVGLTTCRLWVPYPHLHEQGHPGFTPVHVLVLGRKEGSTNRIVNRDRPRHSLHHCFNSMIWAMAIVICLSFKIGTLKQGWWIWSVKPIDHRPMVLL